MPTGYGVRRGEIERFVRDTAGAMLDSIAWRGDARQEVSSFDAAFRKWFSRFFEKNA
jgi:hypothetical protein